MFYLQEIKPKRVFQGSNTVQVDCPECSQTILKTSLAKHLKTHDQQYPAFVSTCVDLDRGLYLVNCAKSGSLKPIHVKKKTFGEHMGVRCTSSDCEAAYAAMIGGLQPGWDCEHVQSVSSSPPFEQPEPLDEKHLQILLDEKIISSKSVCDAVALNRATRDVPVVPYLKKFASSERFHFYSVKNNKSIRGGIFGRVVVTFTQCGTLQCDCSRHIQRRWCVHKSLCLWFIHQMEPHLLQELKENEQLYEKVSNPTTHEEILYPPSNENLVRQMIDYIHKRKRIPYNIAAEANVMVEFTPVEDKCLCGSPLSEKMMVTNKGKLILPGKVVSGLYTSRVETTVSRIHIQ